MRLLRSRFSLIRPCWDFASILFATILFASHCNAADNSVSRWIPIGPDGGDARAFAAVPGHPEHLYLGTLNSMIYESMDEGASWRRLAKLDGSDDLVIDNLAVDASDAQTIFAGAWKLGQSGGGLWISHNAGKSWTESADLKDQAVFAFTQAPSNAKVFIAGTLKGVYRSQNSGATWSIISPPESKEIHEVESIAIDPTNPDIVYAGTWHLPWKTEDGGKNWKSIKQGVIEDSDVFSIIIDPAKPKVVFLSACSGIYKSENAGQFFKKIAGIPADARRTRVLMQDPRNHDVVYAGTTQGLYKTLDAGKKFSAMTSADVIVNDVFVDPADTNHVLLATDRGGVLVSKDGGAHFAASNLGISGRKVDALLIDRKNPDRLLAGVLNDKTYGGVFASGDGGKNWNQVGEGLEGRDVFSLSQAQDGTIVAGTSGGIFVLVDMPQAHWEPRNVISNTVIKPFTEVHAGKRINREKSVQAPVIQLGTRVPAIDASGEVWLASTAMGLLVSKDKGATWQGGPVSGTGDFLAVTVHEQAMVAARPDGLMLSNNAGANWYPMGVPTALTRIQHVAFSPDGTLWLGAREGVYFTKDLGKTWLWFERLPFRDVNDLTYDAETNRILVSSSSSDQVFAIDPKTQTWKWWQTGYRIGKVRTDGKRLLATSLFDGVIVEPPKAGGLEAGQK